ncbi:DNA-binding transcriptional repressor FabR [Streptomyces sp. YIM 130001]|uniref:TetR/AcrR family transcriptional regulator n=1 Tax=Streptomyces sp. YIM 130001 TaxID=2259644 RepID=UPI000E64C074|nr:TetR/AcrR family transcriptional regulator [Streptomyces sp. YIM 130001]RII14797.1 DNA-binding transcriptional repressor FabR [Streptomyces sp. YIM 130001]
MVERGQPDGLRQRKRQATRHALFEAAVRLAADQGAENVTVEAISERAGVSPRTFFNYFKSREEAFVMADPEAGERLREVMREAPPEGSMLDVLRDYMAENLSGLDFDPELWSLVALVLSRSPELTSRMLSLQAEDEKATADVVLQRLRDQGEPDRQAQLYSRMIAALPALSARVAVTLWHETARDEPLLDVFHRVFDQLAAGLTRPLGAR